MAEAKTQCEKCGREILQATADRTNGLCMPCKKGWVAHLPIEEVSEPDQSSIPPPVYDIDDFHPDLCRNEDKMHPIHFAYRLWTIIESDDDNNHRRDSHLLEPEVVLRDVCQFDSTMGNGFATQLGYCGGIMTFARGLRAVETLGATEHLEIMQKAKDSVIAEGLEVPTDPGDPYDYDDGIDYDLEKAIDARNGDLDSRYWNLKVDVYRILLEYLQNNRELLLTRKPAEQGAADQLPARGESEAS